jgi:hypothetical protein
LSTLDPRFAELAAELGIADLELPRFTDAELAAASDAPSVAPLLEGLDDGARAAAIAGGRRSLAERGYLDGDEPVEDLRAILTIRSEPTVVAIADALGRERRSLYLYGLGGAGILTEQVDGEVHAFALRSVESVASLLADTADPGRRASEDGPLVHGGPNGETPEGIAEAERAIAAAEHVLRLYVTARAGPEEVQEFDVSVASGREGVWFVSGHRAPTGESEVWARRLGRASLEVAFASLLSGPVVVPS